MNRLYILLINLLVIFSCSPSDEGRVIIISCNEIEALDDINYSIKQNDVLIKKYKIKVVEKNLDFCGYTFIYKNQEKRIEGAYTDVDLLLEIKDFFEDKIGDK